LTALALLLILAVAGWRITSENSLWCDEIVTAILSNLPVEELIDKASLSSHPATYYLAIKAWNKLGRLAGLDPGVAWDRLPGLLGWLALILGAWRIGRRLLGGDGGALLVILVAVSAQTFWAVRTMRGYALATPTLGLCFLLMAWIAEIGQREAPSRRAFIRVWTLYALAGGVAIGSILLSGVVLLLLGLWWLGLCAQTIRRQGWHRAWRSPLAAGGVLAHAFIVLCFLPTLIDVFEKLAHHPATGRGWMTPPTVMNFLRVFALWYPWGLQGGLRPGAEPWQMAVGALTLLVVAPAMLCRRRSVSGGGFAASAPARHDAAIRLAMAGLFVALLNVAILWTIDRFRPNLAFHGPRYTISTNPAWAAGLAGLYAWASRRWPWRWRWTGGAGLAWLLAIPWLASNLIALGADVIGGPARDQAREIRAQFGDPSSNASPLYVMPSELIPYFSRTLAGYPARRIEALAETPDGARGVRVLNLNMWINYDRDRDRAILAALTPGKLADAVQWVDFPPGHSPYDYYRACVLSGFHAGVMRRLADNGFHERSIPTPPGALAMVTPRDLKMSDGWNYMEIGADQESWRWSSATRAKARLNAPLAPGTYAFEIHGLRQPCPHSVETLRIAMEGESAQAALTLPSGWFSKRVELTLTRPHKHPILVFEHPVFRMDVANPQMDVANPHSNDPRFLGWMFSSVTAYGRQAATR
jgi:hypothetical protein